MRRYLALALMLPALWIAWQALSLAQAQANAVRPQTALEWRADFAPALGRQAEALTATAVDSSEFAEARGVAQQALLASPLELRALRSLGLLAARQDDGAAAQRLMQLAAARSLRDPVAHAWLFDRAYKAGDWDQALFHADVLLRKPMPGYSVAPAVVMAAFEPQARGPLVERMRHSPRWRSRVIEQIARVSPPLAFDILMRLAEAGSPATNAEAGTVVQRMVREGAVANAYVAWTQLLPPNALERLGDVYDEGFDGLPGGPPFNWDLRAKESHGAELAPGPDGAEHVLYVRFAGRKAAGVAEQILLAPPGRYRMTARTYMDEPRRGDEVRWTLTCLGGQTLARLDGPEEAMVWREGAVWVDIPASGCDVQRLALTLHSPFEPSGVLRAWIDRISLQRAQ